jgi:hypothetical protein
MQFSLLCMSHWGLVVNVQVQDECGRGTPVGFMITTSDTVEVVETFMRTLQRGVSEGQGSVP